MFPLAALRSQQRMIAALSLRRKCNHDRRMSPSFSKNAPPNEQTHRHSSRASSIVKTNHPHSNSGTQQSAIALKRPRCM
jgi:hypothetical protein